MHRPSTRPLVGEQFEARYCLSGIAFAPHNIDVPDFLYAQSIDAADIDGDDHRDIVVGTPYGIWWARNLDGQGSFGPPQFVTALSELGHRGVVFAADLDGDGDDDVASLSTELNGPIAWYENRDGRGNFGPLNLLATTPDRPSNMTFEPHDLDMDGDLDVLVAMPALGERLVSWFENMDGRGTFGPQQMIATDAPVATVGDLDRDGDLDLISASWTDETIVWHENDGSGVFAAAQPLLTGFGGQIVVEDINDNGAIDLIIAGHDGFVQWFEKNENVGEFQLRYETDIFEHGSTTQLLASDLDADGDLDLVTAVEHAFREQYSFITWYETSEAGRLIRRQTLDYAVIDPGAAIADLNGDGLQDLLLGIGRVAWHAFEPVPDQFGPRQFISGNAPPPTTDVTAVDLDGDGDLDSLTLGCPGSFFAQCISMIGWYENLDGTGTFGPRQSLSESTHFRSRYIPHWIAAEDLDQDGDLDVLTTLNGRLIWYENDGGGFLEPVTTVVEVTVDWHLKLDDLNNDGNLDVLNVGLNDRGIIWHAGDGTGSFEPAQSVTSARGPWASLRAADLDGDGDKDVLASSHGNDVAVWFENQSDTGTFGPGNVIVTGSGADFAPGDIDGDGDQDLLLRVASGLVWYENTDGKGTFERRPSIGPRPSGSLRLRDLDRDGDLDALVGSVSDLAWYENTDGQGRFGPRNTIVPAWPASPGDSDIDGDGDADILTDVRWYEQRPLGDVTGDDLFNSADLTAIIQAGKYEDDVEDNTTFYEGDWNGDGDFDSADLVLAFQAGTYTDAAVAGWPDPPPDMAVAVEWLFDQQERGRQRRSFVP